MDTPMTDARVPGQGIAIASVPNMRDLGGWPTSGGGTVRYGLLFRSTDLTNLAGPDVSAFEELGIRTVYDLRTGAERSNQPDRVPMGTELVVLDVIKDSVDAAPAQLFNVLVDPRAAEEMLGGGRGLTLFEAGYREIVSLPSALSGYGRLFSDLLSAEHRPALFHCTTGKDRTGWAAASMLMLLGVPDDLVLKEYLLTNDQLLPSEQPAVEKFRALGGDPDVLFPVLGVAPEYLEASLDEMRKKFGTIKGYFADGLGLDAGAQDELQALFIQDA
jgi:protein-tyrosine phosphatase